MKSKVKSTEIKQIENKPTLILNVHCSDNYVTGFMPFSKWDNDEFARPARIHELNGTY